MVNAAVKGGIPTQVETYKSLQLLTIHAHTVVWRNLLPSVVWCGVRCVRCANS